jgi:hypothetical protein
MKRSTHGGGGDRCTQKLSKPERRRPFGRSSYMWKVGIKMYVTEIGHKDRVQLWVVENSNEMGPRKAGRLLTS